MFYFILFVLHFSDAQTSPAFYPFKGFHVGISGQAQFPQKCSFIALAGSDPAPKPKQCFGWESGIEFSYHFAKYFGIVSGINLGRVFSFNYDIYRSNIPDSYGRMIAENQYDKGTYSQGMNKTEILLPIKFEFHYPLLRNLFFTVEAGIRLKGIFERLFFGKQAIGNFENGYVFILDSLDIPGDEFETIEYYNSSIEWNTAKIRCDVQIGLGLYYMLPYGDLLRFTTGINLSFNPICGYYIYPLTDSFGTISIKNDFIYTKLSYIHTFNYQRAKKYLKNQKYSFSSKKERRQRIFDLL